MSRPDFRDVFLRLALDLASRSTCRRMAVGCVVTSTDHRRVYAIGYNGNASGLANDCDRDEPGRCGCLHAEENAAINCDVPRAWPKVVYCTHQPCVMCVKRLINLGGIERIVYVHPYRLTEGLELLREVGIAVEQRAVEQRAVLYNGKVQP